MTLYHQFRSSTASLAISEELGVAPVDLGHTRRAISDSVDWTSLHVPNHVDSRLTRSSGPPSSYKHLSGNPGVDHRDQRGGDRRRARTRGGVQLDEAHVRA